MGRKKTICLDFDGTCVENQYPLVGKSIDAEYWLKLVEKEFYVSWILWTMRTGNELRRAEKWLEDVGIPLVGICHNPAQARWSSSPKVYGHLYIEDTALGVPTSVGLLGKKHHINWAKAGPLLWHWCTENCAKKEGISE